MAQADGQVLIDTKIDTDGMEKGFNRLTKSMDSIGDHAKTAGNRIRAAFAGVDVEGPINKTIINAQHRVQQLAEQYANIVNELKSADINDKSTDRLAMQREKVYDRLAEARRRLALEVAAAAQKEAAAEEKAAARKAKAEEKAQKKRLKDATKGLSRIRMRMSEIAMGSIIYNTLGQAVLAMTKYIGSALKSNDQFSASFARLKGVLLTAFQPIYEVVAPALIYLMNVLTAVVGVIGRFFAALSGKSYSQLQKNAKELYEQADGINAVGSAAKKAKKALAGFDEINKLSFPDASAGGAASGVVVPDFSDPEPVENLGQILYLVGAVAAALGGWKIAKLFTDDLNTVAGVSMAIGGAFLMATNWADAFANGLDWDNLSGMMLGLAVAVGGLALAFGATGAAVGLLIGGVALIVLAIKEWIETGELGEEACAALALGITAIGVAISLITKGPIPAIIAAVAAFAIACVTNGDKVKEAFNKVLDWIKGFFLRDWRVVFGDTLGSILNGFSDGAIGIIDGLKQVFGGLVDFVKGVFTGDWKLAWQGLQNIVKGIFNGIIGAVNGLVSGCCKGLNALIRAINKINFTIPEWVPSYGGKKIGFNLKEVSTPQIPYLAKGAVIPGGNPFLAVLGDQKKGQTNIEAPLPTIKQAVAEVIGDLLPAMMAGFEAVVAQQQLTREAVENIELDGETLSKAIDRYNRKMAVMRGG